MGNGVELLRIWGLHFRSANILRSSPTTSIKTTQVNRRIARSTLSEYRSTFTFDFAVTTICEQGSQVRINIWKLATHALCSVVELRLIALVRYHRLEHASQRKEPCRMSSISDTSAHKHRSKRSLRDHSGCAVSRKFADSGSVVHFANFEHRDGVNASA